jgi:hypothetical protein
MPELRRYAPGIPVLLVGTKLGMFLTFFLDFFSLMLLKSTYQFCNLCISLAGGFVQSTSQMNVQISEKIELILLIIQLSPL